MQEILNPDKHDLIRETIIVLIGLISRWITLRKIKKQKNEVRDQVIKIHGMLRPDIIA